MRSPIARGERSRRGKERAQRVLISLCCSQCRDSRSSHVFPSREQDRFEIQRGLHYRAIQKNWFGQRSVPLKSRRICGDQIPQKPLALTAVRMRCSRGFFDRNCDEVAGVPELPNAVIVEPIQHTGAGRAPIGRKHWLPYREDHHGARPVILQNLLDRGGPPQTCWSGGREQQDDAETG